MKIPIFMLVLGLFLFITPLVFAYPEVPRPWERWGEGTLEITIVSALGFLESLLYLAAILSELDRRHKENEKLREQWNKLLCEFLKHKGQE